MKMVHLSIRVDETINRKFHFVSKYNGRTSSGQILHCMNRCIAQYEKEHGPVALAEKK